MSTGEHYTSCPNSPGVIWNRRTGEAKSVRCKKDSCPYCGPLKLWQLRKDIDYGVQGLYRMGRYIVFITLTTSYESDQSSIMTYWARFRAFIAHYGLKLQYVLTKERKHGLTHLHIIADHFVPYNLLQAAWWASTGKTAWKTDIRKVDMRKSPSWYIVKYVTKDRESHQAHLDDADGLDAQVQPRAGSLVKRVTFSQAFPRRPRAAKGGSDSVYLNNDSYKTVKDMVQ